MGTHYVTAHVHDRCSACVRSWRSDTMCPHTRCSYPTFRNNRWSGTPKKSAVLMRPIMRSTLIKKNANFKQKTQITYTLSLLSESIFTPIARRARSNGNPWINKPINTSIIERFSNDCRKTKTKVITLTNHNRNKQRHEPIRIPSDYLKLARSAAKITRTRCDWFWFCFSLVEKLAWVF